MIQKKKFLCWLVIVTFLFQMVVYGAPYAVTDYDDLKIEEDGMIPNDLYDIISGTPSDAKKNINFATPSNSSKDEDNYFSSPSDADIEEIKYDIPTTATISNAEYLPEPYVAPMGITMFHAESVEGYLNNSQMERETFDRQVQFSSVRSVHKTKNIYSRDHQITLKMRRKGGMNGTVIEKAIGCEILESAFTDPIVDPMTGAAIEWSETYTLGKIDPDVSQIVVSFHVMRNLSTEADLDFYRDVIILLEDERSSGPTSLQVVYDPAYPDSYVLEGANSTMEYRLSSDNYLRAADPDLTWTPCSDELNLLTPQSTETYCYVRYRATEEHAESRFVKCVIPKRITTPVLTLNRDTELVEGLTTEMEYSLDGNSYQPVTAAMVSEGISDIIDTVKGTDPLEMKVRMRPNGQPGGKERIISLYERLAPPVGITLDETTLMMSGLSSAMKYKLDTADKWVSISSGTTKINFMNHARPDRKVAVQIKYKGTTKNSASRPITVYLPILIPAPSTLSINYANETIDGFDPAKKYEFKKTATSNTWTSMTIKNGSYSISSHISKTKDTTMFIREAKTTSSPVSGAVELVLPMRRPAPSDINILYQDTSIKDTQALVKTLRTSQEYKKSSDSAWTSCISGNMVMDLPTSTSTYYFREKATATDFPSDKISLSLKAPGTAPSCTLNLTSEAVEKLKNTMEYRIDGGEYRPVGEQASIPMTAIADSLKEGQTYVIDVRIMRTAALPASKVKTLTVHPRPLPPEKLSYNPSTFKLTGTSSTMQYRELGTETWKSISGTSVTLKTLVNGRPNVQIEVRYKATAGKFVSKPVVVNLY